MNNQPSPNIPDLLKVLEKLKDAAVRHPEDMEVQLKLAAGAVVMMNHFGDEKDWAKLEEWGQLLGDIALRHPENAKIQLNLAKGAFNAAVDYRNAGNRLALEKWRSLLKGAAAGHFGNTEIQLERAKGALNAMFDYGNEKDWARLEEWGQLLGDIAVRHPENAEIQLRLVRSAFNAMIDYKNAENWPAFKKWSNVLGGIAANHSGNVEIQLERAKGAVVAMSRLGDEKNWAAMEEWGKLLGDIATNYPKNAEIQLRLAQGAFNAMIDYGNEKNWAALEEWGRLLRDTATKHPENAEIQLRLAQGAFNAIEIYDKENRSANSSSWKKSLQKFDTGELMELLHLPERQIYRLLDRWEQDDDFWALVGKDPGLVMNYDLRRLWESQDDLLELLRVSFAASPESEKEDKIWGAANYVSVADFERLITPKKNDKGKITGLPSMVKLRSLTSANDPSEGKVLQRFLDKYLDKGLPGKGGVFEHPSEEKMLVLQVSFTRCIDSLNQFRLYGLSKDKDPGTGICMVFDKNFFAAEDERVPMYDHASAKSEKTREGRPAAHNAAEKKQTKPLVKTRAKPNKPLYWVLYYNDRNKENPFFIHTPTQCALRISGKTGSQAPSADWAGEKNIKIWGAITKVQEQYTKAIGNAEDDAIRDIAWRLLIYLRHLVKDATFAEEQEMRIMELCEFGGAEPLRDTILGKDYLPILDRKHGHYVRKVIAGPKMPDFQARRALWRNTIAQYVNGKSVPGREIDFDQSQSPLA